MDADQTKSAQNLIAELRGKRPVSEPEWVTKARSLFQRISARSYQGLALVLAEEALNGSDPTPTASSSTSVEEQEPGPSLTETPATT